MCVFNSPRDRYARRVDDNPVSPSNDTSNTGNAPRERANVSFAFYTSYAIYFIRAYIHANELVKSKVTGIICENESKRIILPNVGEDAERTTMCIYCVIIILRCRRGNDDRANVYCR